jgi:hypothetical protein
MGVRPKLLLRVCAVSSSLLLVAAFVAHRTGALGGWLSSTAVAASTSPGTEPEGESQPEKPVFMGGSKSLVLAPASEARPTPREPRPRPRATAPKAPEDKGTAPEKKGAPTTPSSQE